MPNIKVGDYTLTKEDAIVVDAAIPPSPDLDFQNPIALFTIELRSQTCTISTHKDLYYTASEVTAGVPDIKEEKDDINTNSGDETGD